jgi:hypothetical protein
MSVTFPTKYSSASLIEPDAHQFSVVFTYNIAGGSVPEAVDLAFSVFSNQSGGYVEIFEEGTTAPIVEGDMTDFPKVGLEVASEDADEDSMVGSDITGWDQIDVVFSYNTAVANAEEAFKLAVTVATERSGGYIEVFSNGEQDAVFESDLPLLQTRVGAPAPAL